MPAIVWYSEIPCKEALKGHFTKLERCNIKYHEVPRIVEIPGLESSDKESYVLGVESTKEKLHVLETAESEE